LSGWPKGKPGITGKPEGKVVGNAVGKLFGKGGNVLGNGGSVLGRGKGNGNVFRPASTTGEGAPASIGRTTVGPVAGVPVGVLMVRPGVTVATPVRGCVDQRADGGLGSHGFADQRRVARIRLMLLIEDGRQGAAAE
jgi:hypothetical protein